MNKIILLLLFNVIFIRAVYSDENYLLSPDRAFSIYVQMRDADTAVVICNSAKGYALYRDKFQFESLTDGARLGKPVFPSGNKRNDEWFGQVEVYEKGISIEIPIFRKNKNNQDLLLKIVNQGYSDQGILYPPMSRIIKVLPYKLYTSPKYLQIRKIENSQSKFLFKRVSSVEPLKEELALAKSNKKYVLLDFYAGWCTYCNTYEYEIYGNKEIQKLLSDFILLQVDITVLDIKAREITDLTNVIAPPTILFWNKEGEELTNHRAVGPINAEQFKKIVNNIVNEY